MYDKPAIKEMVAAFDADDLVSFLKKIGIPTYVGSSGKIFPAKHIKPIDVLQQWLQYLRRKGATFQYETSMVDFDKEAVYLDYKGTVVKKNYSKLVMALGGASWSKTGSTGAWLNLFESKGISTLDFQASNAGVNITFSEVIKAMQGTPIKHLNCRLGAKVRYGEIVLTEYGFEGAPIFYLNGAFRNGATTLFIDTKPNFDILRIEQTLNQAKNPTEGLKQLKISKVLIAYIKEQVSKSDYLTPTLLATFVKKIPFQIESLRPIEEAISTVGGVCLENINSDLSLPKFENIYCCGEMLDWDAPTGGYLLQACFASGAWVGRHLK